MRTVGVALVAALVAGGCAGDRADDEVIVFAAASLADALADVAELHSKRTGERVRANHAASSTLAKQIAAGAPADVFCSAHADWTDWLATRGRLAGDAREILRSSLVVVAPRGRGFTLDGPLAFAFEGRLALGDPDHVPAGVYARELLERSGDWEVLRARVVRAPDVRGALALVERGECAAGIVYATDAAAGNVDVVATLPASVTYTAAVVAGSVRGAAFLETLLSHEAAVIFRRHGFEAAGAAS